MKKINILRIASVILGLFYGLSISLYLRNHRVGESSSLAFGFEIMSVAYLFIVPAVMGFLTVIWADRKKPSWLYALFMPWVTVLLGWVFVFVMGWEGTICLFMALPPFLVSAMLGGILAKLVTRGGSGKTTPLVLLVLVLPFMTGAVENYLPPVLEYRTVKSEIVIHATSQTVWSQIIRIPKITDLPPSFVYKMGFPKPIEASLSHDGVGGVRDAVFERGLRFTETITTWDDEHLLSFQIKADPNSIPPQALDEHVTIGGKYFDVLQGTYEIEPVSGDQVILHLKSNYRLSTHFNLYSGLWSDFVLGDVQRTILAVIKKRCEGG
jgi:hypothetical protein